MKILKQIYITLFSLLLLGFASCELTPELDDYEPLYSLPAETAITGEPTAELALTGIYSGFRQLSSGSGNPEIYIVPDLMSGYAQGSFYNSTDPEVIGWISNDPLLVGASNQTGIYTRMYDIVNRSNWLIASLEKLSDNDFETPGRRNEIIAEAKTLRAVGHFYLLRLFGQFYDVNSEYGIDIRLIPAENADAQPRKSVADSYKAIFDDLDAGIADGPEPRGTMYVNKYFAKGLKAKALLYKGDYAAAASLANELISDGMFSLAPDYAEQFQPHTSVALYDNPEILFGSSGDSDAGLGIGNFYSGFFAAISQNYIDAVSDSIQIAGQTILFDGGRATSVLNVNNSYGGYWSSKYTSYFADGTFEMIYHLRLAEVYLILAEASARAGSSVSTEALNALNDLRIARGATTGGDGYVTYPE
ncbi:MAG TPA: RagB/SusD family nutrient uptake outer membrane protein, partial [Draconibacterium sp.]|nr:RagB/SusD family nutrient uptake outer membrane protein [Draconibacterium sp.]